MRKLLLALLLAAAPAWAQVALTDFGTTNHTAGTTASRAYTVTGGTNSVAVAIVLQYPAASVTPASPTVNWAGAAMTSASCSISLSDAHYRADIFWKVNPTTGSQNLDITGNSDHGGFYYNVYGLTGVDQATPVRASSVLGWPLNGTDDSTSPQTFVIPNTVSGDMVVTGGMNTGGVTSTNATAFSADNGGAKSGITDYKVASGTSLSDIYTWVASTSAIFCGLAMKQASSASVKTGVFFPGPF